MGQAPQFWFDSHPRRTSLIMHNVPFVEAETSFYFVFPPRDSPLRNLCRCFCSWHDIKQSAHLAFLTFYLRELTESEICWFRIPTIASLKTGSRPGDQRHITNDLIFYTQLLPRNYLTIFTLTPTALVLYAVTDCSYALRSPAFNHWSQKFHLGFVCIASIPCCTHFPLYVRWASHWHTLDTFEDDSPPGTRNQQPLVQGNLRDRKKACWNNLIHSRSSNFLRRFHCSTESNSFQMPVCKQVQCCILRV